MHIDSVHLYRVLFTDRTSECGARLESVFVEMRSGEHVGFGEVTLNVGPTDCAEWAQGAFACLRDWLAPAVVGRSIASGQDLQAALEPFRGNERAKSALDVAWWALAAAAQATPLHELLGGTRTAISLACTFGVMDSEQRLLRKIGEAFECGYERVNLKFRPGWDLNMLRAVRQAFAAESLSIDCDGLCTLQQQEMFYRMEDFFLHSIEQPLAADDLVGHAMLQSSIHTPVGLDQSVTSLDRVEQAIDLGSCQRVRIDIGRVGGITPALAIRDACTAAKIAWAVGGGPGSQVASSANAALAASSAEPLPVEASMWGSKLGWGTSSGPAAIQLPDSPGFGFLPDVNTLAGAALERATI